MRSKPLVNVCESCGREISGILANRKGEEFDNFQCSECDERCKECLTELQYFCVRIGEHKPVSALPIQEGEMVKDWFDYCPKCKMITSFTGSDEVARELEADIIQGIITY